MSKQSVLRIIQEIYVYGFNNNVLLIPNVWTSKGHLINFANNTQINVLVMVLLAFPFRNVQNMLIKLVVHLELMGNVDG